MKIHQVLVTGANGFIGYHLCKKLLEQHYKVIGLTRSQNPPNLLNLEDSKRFQIAKGDINDRHYISDLFNKFDIDAILHLAIAPPSQSAQIDQYTMQDSSEFETNFSGTLNLLNGAHQAGIKNWIQSSTMSVFDFNNPEYLPVNEDHPTDPAELYGFTKLLAENACKFYWKSFGFNVVILRYSGVFGIGKNQGLIAKLSQQCIDNDIELFNASTNRTSDFVYVDDVVNANLLALKKIQTYQNSKTSFFDIFNIGSGQEISVHETANLIKELTQSKCKIVAEISENPRKFYFDCSKAIKQLSYNPSSVKQSLQKYISQVIKSKNGTITN